MNIQALIASILAALTGIVGGVVPGSSIPALPIVADWDDWDDDWDDDDWDDDDWDDDWDD